jgi:hypothetical protein
MTTEDIEHLESMYKRMILIHGENPYSAHMFKFNGIIMNLRKNLNSATNYYTSPSKSDKEFSLFSGWRDDPRPDRDDDDSWSTGTIRHFQD